MQPLKHNLSRDVIAFARDRLTERAQTGVGGGMEGAGQSGRACRQAWTGCNLGGGLLGVR